MKITKRLSAKEMADGKREILLSAKRKVADKVITMSAKSSVYVLPIFFDSEKEIIDINKKRVIDPQTRKETIAAQKKLDEIVLSIAKAEELATEFDKDWLKNAVECFLHPKDEADHDFFASYLDFCKRKRYFPLKSRYSMLRQVKRYETYRRITEDKEYIFDPTTITKEDIEDLQNYLLNEFDLLNEDFKIRDIVMSSIVDNIPNDGKPYIRPRGTNATFAIMKLIQPYFRDLQESGKIRKNPFKGAFIVKATYGNPIYPTIEERNKIYATPMPTPSLEIVRDAWVLQSVLGCRISDLMRIKEANIENDVLEYTPVKTRNETGSKAQVPLNEIAKEIIAKYRGKDRQGRLMPFMQPERENEYIKKVFRLAGVTRNVEVRDPLSGENVVCPIAEVATTHMARRCFVGAAYSKVKDPNIVAKMSGHIEGSKSFCRYRKIDTETLKEVTSEIVGTRHEETSTLDVNTIAMKLASLTPEQIKAIKDIIG